MRLKLTLVSAIGALAVLPLLLSCIGEGAPVLSSPYYTDVSSGWYHTCALRDDGAAVCWGAGTTRNTDYLSERYGEIHLGQADPPPDERFVTLSSGGYHTCGLRDDGTAVCWGAEGNEVENELGQSSPPPDERFVALSSGSYHTCGLREDGTAACWGDDDFGKSTPPEGGVFKDIASGGRHTCGLRMDNTALCWGQQPGHIGYDYWQETPPTKFSKLEPASAYTCGLIMEEHWSGALQCWGYQSDTGSALYRSITNFQGDRLEFKTISIGSGRGCGLRENGQPICWGYLREPYSLKYRFSDISAGVDFFCGVRKDNGGLVCWGGNEYGQSSPPGGETIEEPPETPDWWRR